MLPILQYCLPQHGLSRFAGFCANLESLWVKNRLIQYFLNRYPVNMSEAVESNPFAYKSFNDFFTRPLKADLRPITPGLYDFACPADAVISQMAPIEKGRLIQVKGKDFTLEALMGAHEKARVWFDQGDFITFYLAPPDYHRVHMPIDGDLSEMIYIPGQLFSVNEPTTEGIPQLFARNERLVTLFDTSAGKLAVILVGAMLVGSIETPWSGIVVPQSTKSPQRWRYPTPHRIKRGEEVGRFRLGSTVIVLLQKGVITWSPDLQKSQGLQFGQKLGEVKLSI